ncbi:MAG TPA: cellulase family glycosylhydrolase [Polyangiaceae bacterium]|nr:cellulase family glycosylhydrolase [Polyangiaceae bacterium]
MPPAPQLLWSTLLIALASSGCAATPHHGAQTAATAPNVGFVVDGRPLCFAGANSYYPIYKPRAQVDDVLDAARALNLKVLRVWGMLDRGSLDGSVPNADGAGQKDGVYFQYWDTEQRRPAYNDGPSGLEHLDYVLAAAAQRDLKLIIVLVNNWRAFGGIDQYLMWYGLSQHHEFFSAPGPRRAYRDWLEHVITRQNTVNGRVYRDDPSIFAWELANEPRCKNGSSFDAADGWDRDTITRWAHEMSAQLKALDPNHLVSVGDEGFFAGGGREQPWAYRAPDGVDHAALSGLPSVDFATFHLYPEDWGFSEPLAERWIVEHVELARRLGKPTILEEYGLRAAASRAGAYQRWNDLLLAHGSNASLAWMLAGAGEHGQRYPDFDRFTFYRDDATGELLGRYARALDHAPACDSQAGDGGPTSPFVGVARR